MKVYIPIRKSLLGTAPEFPDMACSSFTEDGAWQIAAFRGRQTPSWDEQNPIVRVGLFEMTEQPATVPKRATPYEISTLHYKSVVAGQGVAVISSGDNIAQQQFFGWGSDRDAIDASFYGNNYVGNNEWVWHINREGALRMIDNIQTHINDVRYYALHEVPMAQELLDLLLQLKPDLE